MLLAPMLARLAAADTIDDTLRIGLRDIVALHGTEMGDIQMIDARGRLAIVEAWNVPPEFLERFADLDAGDGTVCARSFRSREPLFIPDVASDAEFAPYAKFAATVPFKAVLSCPLVASCGEPVGMVSVLSANEFRPTDLEMLSATRYAQKLADAILARVPDRAAFAKRRSLELRRMASTLAS
jgi:GAF domain-containing protein